MTTMTEAVLHGYTMQDIAKLAAGAVHDSRKWLGDSADMRQATDLAWEGIVSALCKANEPPTANELLRAGWMGVKADAAARRAMVGKLTTREGYSVQFEQYWSTPPLDFEEALVEHIGFQQAWAALRPYHQETFAAYVEAGYNKSRAAEILGIGRTAMHRRISLGYEAFAKLWYGDESIPARPVDRDTWERPDQRDPDRPNSIQNLPRRAA